MAELGPKELRRLESLQEKLAASQQAKKAWTEERRLLKARLTAAERTAKKVERTEEAASQLRQERDAEREKLAAERRQREELQDRARVIEQKEGSLIDQNRDQAERLAELVNDVESLRSAASEAVATRDRALVEAREAAAARQDLEGRVKGLEDEGARLREALRSATLQLKSQDRPRVLPAAEVAGLVSSFLGQLRSGLPGLDVRDGDLKLKLAFASDGENPGFVIPTIDSPESIGPIHEVDVHLDRLPDS